jgi:prepilin-type N-terminal cleavage/methylation domain-containing protein
MFEKVAQKKLAQNKLATSHARRGLTLVEVVTSIAILSTMLVMLLVGYARHMRQIQQASRLQRAVELSDHLLADWFRDDVPIIEHRLGAFVDDSDYSWRLTARPVSTGRLGGQVVQLQTFFVADKDQTPVLTVELLIDRAAENQAGTQ